MKNYSCAFQNLATFISLLSLPLSAAGIASHNDNMMNSIFNLTKNIDLLMVPINRSIMIEFSPKLTGVVNPPYRKLVAETRKANEINLLLYDLPKQLPLLRTLFGNDFPEPAVVSYQNGKNPIS